MATTPNYSWVMPAPTDFVTDLPADFETFGDAVDASLYALSPGTTAGDLDYYTSSTAKARLGIGTAGQVLTVNSGATAPEWAALVAPASMTVLASGSLSSTSLNLTSISADYNDLMLVCRGISVSADSSLVLTINNASSIYGAAESGGGSRNLNGNYNIAGANQLEADVANGFVFVHFFDYKNTSSIKVMRDTFGFKDTGATNFYIGHGIGAANTTAAINQITLTVSGGNSFDAGTYILYGVK